MNLNPHIVRLPNTLQTSILDEVSEGLNKAPGKRTLPTITLYDETGLRLYDNITVNAPEYYLFGSEEQILRDHGAEIAHLTHGGLPVRDGEVIIELGAG